MIKFTDFFSQSPSDPVRFLLTRLMRGATLKLCVSGNSYIISTHTPLTKRDDFKLHIAVPCQVSTHTPHARRDFHGIVIYFFGSVFLLTHLLRGATSTALSRSGFALISTHTPLARRDSAQTAVFCIWEGFYSHASCEARHNRSRCEQLFELFLLTRLLRARRCAPCLCPFRINISTHAPLASATGIIRRLNQFISNFYSHASCEARQKSGRLFRTPSEFLLPRLLRGATHGNTPPAKTRKFLLTRLLRGATRYEHTYQQGLNISTHAPLARRDQETITTEGSVIDFYSRASYEARPALRGYSC